jgi:hypothetical protein
VLADARLEDDANAKDDDDDLEDARMRLSLAILWLADSEEEGEDESGDDKKGGKNAKTKNGK